MNGSIDRDDVRDVDLAEESTGELLPIVHPGEILHAEFMQPLGLSARRLAREIEVPANRITAILGGRRAITAATALRLARRFGTSAEFWMNLQTAADLDAARRGEADACTRPNTARTHAA